jgi:hypothetical protein
MVTARKVLYWLAVLAVSLALVVGVVAFFESRDSGSLEGSRAATQPAPDR